MTPLARRINKNAKARADRKTRNATLRLQQRALFFSPDVFPHVCRWCLARLEAKRRTCCDHTRRSSYAGSSRKRHLDVLRAWRKRYPDAPTAEDRDRHIAARESHRKVRQELETAARFLRLRWEGMNPREDRKTQKWKERQRTRLERTLRARVLCALKPRKIKKAYPTFELLGCTGPELRAHLERLFKPGMTWENRGFWGWHIDHIKPCSSFDLADPAQQRACFHWSNIQPLWARENLVKYTKLGEH